MYNILSVLCDVRVEWIGKRGITWQRLDRATSPECSDNRRGHEVLLAAVRGTQWVGVPRPARVSESRFDSAHRSVSEREREGATATGHRSHLTRNANASPCATLRVRVVWSVLF